MGYWWPGVLAAGMLVLAGCSGFAPAGGPPTGTATPAPVPSPPPSPSPSPSATPETSLPPGVVDGRVADPGAFAGGHRDVLANAAYAVRVAKHTRYANGTTRSHVVSTTRVSRDGLRYVRIVDTGRGTTHRLFENATQVVVYAEGDERYVRAYTAGDSQSDNGTAVRYVRVDRDPFGHPRFSGQLFELLASMELRVSRMRLANGTMYRVRSTALVLPFTLAGVLDADDGATVENASLRALVAPSGLVREYRLNYTLLTDGTVVHGTRSVRYRNFGSAVVRRPAWYEEAVDATRNGTGNANG